MRLIGCSSSLLSPPTTLTLALALPIPEWKHGHVYLALFYITSILHTGHRSSPHVNFCISVYVCDTVRILHAAASVMLDCNHNLRKQEQENII